MRARGRDFMQRRPRRLVLNYSGSEPLTLANAQ